jgi:hypothetical protein
MYRKYQWEVLGNTSPAPVFAGCASFFELFSFIVAHDFWGGWGVCGYFRLFHVCTLFRSSSVCHLGDSTFFDSLRSKHTQLFPHSSKFYRHPNVFIACSWQRTVERANKETCTRKAKVYYFCPSAARFVCISFYTLNFIICLASFILLSLCSFRAL